MSHCEANGLREVPVPVPLHGGSRGFNLNVVFCGWSALGTRDGESETIKSLGGRLRLAFP
jgi:hypothetical protein